MLISLHLPKTAGSSFKKTLDNHFQDELYLDYGDRPLQKNKIIRKCLATCMFVQNIFKKSEHDCIHGHFMPVKYKYLINNENVTFIVWMRESIDRLLSHYYFWIRTYDKDRAGYLWTRMIKEKWSFEKFALCKEMKIFIVNIYGNLK